MGVQGDAERNKLREFGSNEILNPPPPQSIAAGLAQRQPDVMSYFSWLGEQYDSGPLAETLALLKQVNTRCTLRGDRQSVVVCKRRYPNQ